MKRRCHKCAISSPKDRALDLLLTMIFEKALPVWQRYNGAVPPEELYRLDWPRGAAAAAMKRLSRDPQLRKRLAALQ